MEHLRKGEFEILAENYTHQRAEVDIIARTGDILLIVEVKTRRTPNFWPATGRETKINTTNV